jgi:polyferredoxin
MKIGKLRYLTLAAGIVFLGFYFNSAISLSNLSVIFLGYFPPLSEKLFWYMLVVGALLIILIYGKNLYCFWLCPFGAIQELVAKIGGVNIQLSKKTITYAGYISYLLTWAALMIIFTTANSSLGSYEPFATLFGLEGFGVQWYILPVVILGAFVLNRFWCRFFCPVGVVLRLVMKVRFRAKQLFSRHRKTAK